MYSLPIKKCGPTLFQGFCVPTSFWMLVCRLSPWTTVGSSQSLMWAQKCVEQTRRKFSQAASKYRHTKATLHHPHSSNKTRTCKTFIIWTSLQPSFVQQGERSTEIPSACYFSLCVSMSQSQLKNNSLHCI